MQDSGPALELLAIDDVEQPASSTTKAIGVMIQRRERLGEDVTGGGPFAEVTMAE